MIENEHLWAVVLAGGEGHRVSSLTRDESGSAVPKQFWAPGTGGTLLRRAIDRACGVVSPWRVVTAVNEGHRRFWEDELADQPRENVVVEPCSRGTAPGLLLPLLEILLKRDAHARVLVLPSTHYVADEGALRPTLAAALSARRWDGRIVLVGMKPRDADTEYGWIEPGHRFAGSLKTVRRFVDGPDLETARDLMRGGGLWSSFILAGDVITLLRLYKGSLPSMFEEFLGLALGRRGRLVSLYDHLTQADFPREVLPWWPESHLVLAAPECGWTNLGTIGQMKAHLDRQSRPPSGTSESVGEGGTPMEPPGARRGDVGLSSSRGPRG